MLGFLPSVTLAPREATDLLSVPAGFMPGLGWTRMNGLAAETKREAVCSNPPPRLRLSAVPREEDVLSARLGGCDVNGPMPPPSTPWGTQVFAGDSAVLAWSSGTRCGVTKLLFAIFDACCAARCASAASTTSLLTCCSWCLAAARRAASWCCLSKRWRTAVSCTWCVAIADSCSSREIG